MPWGLAIQFPKLTPLQARFAATAVASLVLVTIFIYLSPVRFAYAAELDSIAKDDHNHHRLLDDILLDADIGDDHHSDLAQESGELEYEADFIGLDRSIIGRAKEDTEQLLNNAALNASLGSEGTRRYVFTGSSLSENSIRKGRGVPSALKSRAEAGIESPAELAKRQDTQGDIFISVSVCSQPKSSDPSATTPQLTLYVSNSEDNRNPGPEAGDEKLQSVLQLDQGFKNYKAQVSGDVHIAVVSERLGDSFEGEWSFEIAASTNKPYYAFKEGERLFYVDSDSTSALLITNNLTAGPNWTEEDQRLMDLDSADFPFEMFAIPLDDVNIRGMNNSPCAWRNVSALAAVETTPSMTTRASGGRAKEQFYIEGLNKSSSYVAYMAPRQRPTLKARQLDGVPGAVEGNQVWYSAQFTTKAESNCQMLFDLPFCSEVAYSVPANTDTMNSTELLKFYDDFAAEAYKNFSRSLQQVACDTTATAQYSLVRNCTHCAEEYKKWLCAVTIPRCTDFSSSEEHLQPRNVGVPFPNGSSIDQQNPYATPMFKMRLYSNSSRSPRIDELVKPGPYKELLPCVDHCYSIVKSCPAKLGFSCPSNAWGLNHSYGQWGTPDSPKCNFVGGDSPSEVSPLQGAFRSVFFVAGTAVMIVMNLI